MKKLLLLLLLSLVSCAGAENMLLKDGNDVLINKSFLNKISGQNEDLPYYFSADTSWLKEGKLTPAVGILNDADDYQVANDMANQPFQIFQVQEDDLGNVLSVNWVADITADPNLKLRENLRTSKPRLDDGPVAQAGVTGTNNGPNNETFDEIFVTPAAVKFIIQAVKVDNKFDCYNDVNDRYGKDTRYFISWDANAIQADEIQQFLTPDSASVNTPVAGHSIVVDSRQGLYLKLLNRGQLSFMINPDKPDDLELLGLSLVSRATGDDYYLKIITGLKPLRQILRKHYSLKQKYPEGYYQVAVPELKGDSSDLYRLCLIDGDIAVGQDTVIVGVNYFKKYASDTLQKKYQGREIKP